jgi:hypothetical protein
MGKYESLEKGIFSIFGKAAWTAENIKTQPSNYLSVGTKTEFIRVSLIPSGKGLNLGSASGVIIIDIFTPAGKGPQRFSFIADKLDMYLAGKSVTTSAGTVQCGISTMNPRGADVDNPGLHWSQYTIPFNFFGVTQ